MNMSNNVACSAAVTMSPRKEAIRRLNDELAPQRARWLDRAAFFHEEDLLDLKFLIPEGLRVLELGCGTGHLLASLKPSFGVGVDFSAKMIANACKTYPHLAFLVGDIEEESSIKSLPGPFDVILIADTLGSLDDCQHLFESLHLLCTRETRVIIAYFSHVWYPALTLAERLGMRMRLPQQNVLAPADIQALAALADFEIVKVERRMLTPVRMLGLGRKINRFIAPFPLIRSACLRHYSVCRSLRRIDDRIKSATVIVPARNERGNIEAAVRRISRIC